MDHVIRFHRAVKDTHVSCRIVLNLLEIMGNDNQKLILRHLAKKLNNLLGGCRVKVSRRLIGKDDGTILGKRTGNNRSLLLTA